MSDSAAKIEKPTRHEAKVFLLSSIVLSSAVFNIAFWYGVSGTVFFEHLLHVWLVATVALAATTVIPHVSSLPAFIAWRGRFVLALPSLWLALEVVIGPSATLSLWQHWLIWLLAAAMLVVTLPYVAYVLIVITVPEIERLQGAKLRGAVLGFAIAAACVGVVMGHHHPRILTCEDFKVAGNFVPGNCSPAASRRLLEPG